MEAAQADGRRHLQRLRAVGEPVVDPLLRFPAEFAAVGLCHPAGGGVAWVDGDQDVLRDAHAAGLLQEQTQELPAVPLPPLVRRHGVADVAPGVPELLGEAVAQVALPHGDIAVHEPIGACGDHPILQADALGHVHLSGEVGGELVIGDAVGVVEEAVLLPPDVLEHIVELFTVVSGGWA